MSRTLAIRSQAVSVGLAALALAASSAPSHAVVPRRYSITEIGTLRTDHAGSSAAVGLNNNGVVVGFSDGDNQNKLALKWDSVGGLQNLKLQAVTLGGDNSAAYGINDSVQIAGEAQTPANPIPFGHAFMFGPSMTDLNGRGPFLGGQNSRAIGINNSGVTVGEAQLQGAGTLHPFRFTPGGAMVLLPNFGSGGRANAINSGGTAVGILNQASGSNASIWAPNGALTILSFTGALVSEAFGINDAGIVVGARKVKANWGAFIYSPVTNRATPLARIGTAKQSWAYGINSSNQIVGQVGSSSQLTRSAVIWDGKQAVNLNSRIPTGSGWRLIGATAINNGGQIVGTGLLNGNQRGFILTPN